MPSTVKFDMTTFDAALIQSDLPVLVDFWAEWCPPCRALGPAVDAIADRYEGQAIVGKVNIDDHRELARRYEIKSIPTILIFRNGEIVDRLVGVRPETELASALDAAIDSIPA